MNIFKNYIRLWMLLVASLLSCVAIAQEENYGIGDGFDPANPGNPGSNGWNAATGEAVIDDFTTGNLNNTINKKIGNSGSAAVTQIVVAGVINNTDFRVGNNYAKCTLVDFSRTAGISSVPSSAYSGNTHLCSIMLPTSITDIGSNAFNGCSALTAITSYTLTPPEVGSNALNGVADNMIVYVPSEAVDRYQEADIWKNFTILPIQETVHSLMVNMPSDIDLGAFKNMTLELVNAKSGQSYRYIITDKASYVFNNLIENTVYKAYVKNNQNNIFGETNEVSVNDKDAEVTFSSLSIPQSVNLSIKAGGNDITSQATVTWTDSIGNYLSQGSSLTGYAIGKNLNYTIALPQNVVMEYALPNTTQYIVADGGNNIVCTLTPLQKVVITGKVLDLTTKSAISGAVVSASQTFGGKYSKTTNVKTDSKGQYSIEVFRVPTSLAIAASDYISQTKECDLVNAEGENVSVADVSLKSISGAVISIDFTYKKCPDNADEEGEVETFYSDYNNVDYTIFNKTQNRSIGQYNVQYPQIVLLEEVNENDVLELTASSRTSAFVPVKATATIDAEQRASATFNIVGLGKLRSTFDVNGNASVVGSLYDAKGKLIKTYDYSGSSLTISDLADGNYTLVTMGSSKLFNTIYDLNQLPQTGLTMGADYAQNSVKVESGKLSVISIAEVPTLDESKLYYTGENTSFTVNKPSIVAGNYLTLTGHLDFKSAYSTKVSNVNLIVDLPESCSFVENSVMVGNSTSSYTLEGNRIIIPMARYTDRVRFCIIPTVGGAMNISAYTNFDMEGVTRTQPIGMAHAVIKDIEISVPSVINIPQLLVKGHASPGSKINIYWDRVLSGTCISNKAGNWQCHIEFDSLLSYSEHSIFAKIEVSEELTLLTESKTIIYDEECPIINKVTMINTAHPSNSLNLCEYVTIFDFTNSEKPGTYWYWPSYPKFTFIADVEAGKGNRLSDVTIFALTERGQWKPLEATYDSIHNSWIATDNFYSGELPVNVGITYHYITDDISIDRFISSINNSDVEYIDEEQTPINIQVSDDGKTITFPHNELDETEKYVKSVFSDVGILSVDYVEDGINCHFDMSISGTNNLPNEAYEYRINHDNSFYISTETSGSIYRSVICYPVAMIDNMLNSPKTESWHFADIFNEFRQNAHGSLYAQLSCEIRSETTNMMSKRSSTFDYAEEMCPELSPIIDRMKRRAEHSRRMNDDLNRFRNATEWIGRLLNRVGPAGQAASSGIDLGNQSIEFGQNAGNYINSLADRNDMAALQAAGCLPSNQEPNYPNPNDNGGYVMDPSGYVYEGVSSNRLEGVTATAYYKEIVEDMYGDKHENIVKWDAEEYAQENPLFTDEYGMYAWDVPQGLWQVKFEKEGYETTYSEWLPVPPPQLDINIAMKQNVQPTVNSARAFEDAVEMEFDKYMMPELLTSENIRVMAGEKAVEGTVELLNEEVSYEGNEEKFASKVRFNAAAPFDASEVTLMVSNRVKSYAGIRMQDDFSQTFTIEPEVQKIVCDAEASIEYGGQGELTVQVLPAVASAGKTLKVKSSSVMILSTDVEELTLDSDGKASLKVGGELPGAAAITYSVDGYDLSATTMVNVEQVQLIPDRPLASIASGSALLKGTQITLSCPTSGAEIYYTTDGSCPCEAGAKKYDGTPITISESTTLKIMAVGKKGDESEIVTYTYTIRQTNMTVDIQEGWNWISHNQYEGLKADALMADGINCIRNITGEVSRNPLSGFVGHLDDIMPSEAVKVLAGSATSIALSGVMANPATTTITLQKGWNWLGYPLSNSVTVSDALSRLQAEEGDCITSLGAGFAQYSDGKWTGDLSVMTPGTGYMYKSVSGNVFQYDETKKVSASAINTEWQESSIPWSVDARKYPDMMCITAQVVKAGMTCDAENYLLGAFVNGECRGIGNVIDGNIFLSVYGDRTEPVTFVIVDKLSGEEYGVTETLDFHVDVYGNVREPLILHAGTDTGVVNISDDTPCHEGLYNTLGQRISRVSRNGIFIHNGKKVLINNKANTHNIK